MNSFRYTAYTNYTLWVHGSLGHKVRRGIPTCVTKAIKTAFPSHVYRHFEEAEDDDMD